MYRIHDHNGLTIASMSPCIAVVGRLVDVPD